MKAVILQNGALSVTDIDEPKPQSGEVLIETIRAGICGSDKAAVFRLDEGNRIARKLLGADAFDKTKPMVLGHEYVGRVVSYGPDTKGTIPVGTRIVGIPALRHRKDPVSVGFAGPATPGAYAEKFLMDEEGLIPVPDQVSDELAALTEPATITLRGVQHIKPLPHEVALVLGCGPIGLCTISVLKALGISPIVASDCSPERLALAKTIGADIVIDATSEKPFDALKRAAATDDSSLMARPTFAFGPLPLRPVVAFECTGWPGSMEELIEGLPPSSRICGIGINEQGDHLELAVAIVKELEMVFANYYNQLEFEQSMSMIADNELQVGPMVTKTIGLNDVPAMFEELEHNPREGKVLIDPSR